MCSRPDFLLQRQLKLQIFGIVGVSLLAQRNEVGGNTLSEGESEREREITMTPLTVLVVPFALSPMASHRSYRNSIELQCRQCQEFPD